MIMRNIYETDDADRMPYGCGTFDDCPVGDRDPMYDDAPSGGPRCGGSDYPYGLKAGNYGCEGCKHCNPVDPECQPYGWGIERFERQDILNEASRLREIWPLVCDVRGIDWQRARELAFKWSDYDFALERKSDRVWDRLCDCCETHQEALERYTKWADKATGRKRRK